jgi:hypothetical protein
MSVKLKKEFFVYLIASSFGCSGCIQANSWQPLAQDHVVVYHSPDPENLYAYSPGICSLPGGDLVATIDLGGPGAKTLSGPIFSRKLNNHQSYWQGQVYLSSDGGKTWDLKWKFPFMHARPFVSGKSLYVLGQADDLVIIRSDDNGRSWTEPVSLTTGERWHQAPCNVLYANGCVYLVMEQRVTEDIDTWYVGEIAPVLMRAKIGEDLTRPDAWTFAESFSFREEVDAENIQYMGIPFFTTSPLKGVPVAKGRSMAPLGWLETNVVQINNPDHVWYDSSRRTFHLWMRSHTGGTGYAAIAKVVEQGPKPGAGKMVTQLETVPSGENVVYVPCPGGQMKFHVLYDEQDGLYWLLSTQATDSMIKPDQMSRDRYGLPNNERRRLQLHYSRNMIDWCFAGLVAVGETERSSRHYASMIVDGDDLLVLSRSGDVNAKHAHDGNLISFHRIENFRSLVDPWIKKGESQDSLK